MSESDPPADRGRSPGSRLLSQLDEILRALPGADNSLLTLEHASDDELHAAHMVHSEIRRTALDEQLGADPER
jgi:low affinity Fe/Cu permease